MRPNKAFKPETEDEPEAVGFPDPVATITDPDPDPVPPYTLAAAPVAARDGVCVW